MTSLFSQVESAITPLLGWASVEKAQTLAAMVVALKPDVTVEIGIFGGRSFFGLALAHKHIARGVAWGIDPWTKIAATEGYTGDNLTWWKEQSLGVIHDNFMENVQRLAVQNVVKILRHKSDEVMPPKNISLLHIDGQHSEQAVRDVKRFAPNVRMGGIVVMDDLAWENDGDKPVQRAIEELKRLSFMSLYPLGEGEVFQRV